MDKKRSELIEQLHTLDYKENCFGADLIDPKVDVIADFILARERKLLEEIENALKLPETAFRVRNNEALRIIEERKGQ